MQATIPQNAFVVLRLSSDALKVVKVVPKTLISCGRFGAFPAELLLGRPFFATYEIHEDPATHAVRLRLVPASELNQEALFETAAPDPDADPTGTSTPAAGDDAVVVRDNRLTVDDGARQTLTAAEIEELKRAVTGSGREIIERIMAAHRNLDEKTVFSLAKYALRKAKKFLRRFTVLPLDVGRLAQYVSASKEASRIMELREESLGLITAWSNVHFTPELQPGRGGGKWLVLDDTGGLVVAALAEKMGLLHADSDAPAAPPTSDQGIHHDEGDETKTADEDTDMPDASGPADATTKRRPHPRNPPVATHNTIHVLHPAAQPNLSLLKYFHHDTEHPSTTHPLSSHLLTLSWLQLLLPAQDPTYTEPPAVSQSELDGMKPSRRSTYHRKRRRWQRCRASVDSARAGGFDGLVCATGMAPASVLRQLVPLVRGGGHVVLFSPTLEPLSRAVDLYSRERKAAFIRALDEWRNRSGDGDEEGAGDEKDWRCQRLGTGNAPQGFVADEEDFPVDPRLLLAASVHTSRAREWQVLPGRTHPTMTARGGGEGFVFAARRALPFEGRVEARGRFARKRKVAPV